MKTVILIPARNGSTRYPGKPLALLRTPGGHLKPLIQLSWEAACQAAIEQNVYVTTDDARIAETAVQFGARVILTSAHCRNGTERCAEALAQLDSEPDLVVNFQGDAPLTPAWFVDALVTAMRDNPGVAMATPVLRCDRATCAALLEDRRCGRVGATTAVFTPSGDALYFSKEVIPYIDPENLPEISPVFHHVGVYAYRPDALRRYAEMAPTPLEQQEGLEQLRFLEAGIPVRCVLVEAMGRVFWELNNPSDTARIEAALETL